MTAHQTERSRALIRSDWFYATWLQFLIRYRRTALGPVWVVIAPALFILILGNLYSHIGGHGAGDFVPYLAVGITVWTLIGGLVTGSTTLFQRQKGQLMQGNASLSDIVMIDVFTTFLIFLHQVVILVGVFVYYGIGLTPYALVSLLGLALMLLNGVWMSYVFGILGARFRDISEIVQAIMRIAFLATPILWKPGTGMVGGLMGAYLKLNPFYHFLEVVRAPLLGEPITHFTWFAVVMMTLTGAMLAGIVHRRYGRFVPLWI